MPQIIVSGYDEIRANSSIVIYITDILTLPKSVSATISMGVQLIYKDFGGVSAYYYGPRSLTPQVTTQLRSHTVSGSNFVINTNVSVVYVGPSDVLQKGNYTFTMTLNSSLVVAANQQDFIQLIFPLNFFERFSDYSQVRCQVTRNNNVPLSVPSE